MCIVKKNDKLMRKTEKNYQSRTEKNISTDSKTVLDKIGGTKVNLLVLYLCYKHDSWHELHVRAHSFDREMIMGSKCRLCNPRPLLLVCMDWAESNGLYALACILLIGWVWSVSLIKYLLALISSLPLSFVI